MQKFLGGVVLLKEKFGPILFQLPPNFNFDKERLEEFCKLLPENFRFTFEFRGKDWWNEKTYEILNKHQIAFCIFELGKLITPKIITSGFVYVRLHGPGSRYAGNYSDEILKSWAGDFSLWKNEGKEIYCYFDNDEKGYAPKNALSLIRML